MQCLVECGDGEQGDILDRFVKPIERERETVLMIMMTFSSLTKH